MTESNKPVDPDLERILRRKAEFEAPESPERVAERKRNSARCGHVKRKLREGKRLEGELLEFAISVVDPRTGIPEKLRAGQRLDDYEMHLMFDMYLLHARLA